MKENRVKCKHWVVWVEGIGELFIFFFSISLFYIKMKSYKNRMTRPYPIPSNSYLLGRVLASVFFVCFVVFVFDFVFGCCFNSPGFRTITIMGQVNIKQIISIK